MVDDTLLLWLHIFKYPIFVRTLTFSHLHGFNASHPLKMVIHLPFITVDSKDAEKLQLQRILKAAILDFNIFVVAQMGCKHMPTL